MKDVENVTGQMGEGEAVAPAEAGSDDGEIAIAQADRNGTSAPEPDSNPWPALIQIGAQFVSALAAASNPGAAAHPWIERDAATGSQSLKMPLPPPETARRLADMLSTLADSLRGRSV